jgi:putative hemolysin
VLQQKAAAAKKRESSMDKDTYINYIDLDKAIREKSPKLHSKLPGFVIQGLKRLVHQKDLNDDLNELVANGMKGVDFFTHFMKMKNIGAAIEDEEKLPPADGRYIFVSNHPLGGLDGIAMISLLGRKYPNIRFVVNDLLLHLPNTSPVFVPVNKLGANSRQQIKLMDDVFSDSENQVLFYPAGLVSRKIHGKVQDLEWKKTFITKAVQYGRDIVPLYFDGRNSDFFYNLAWLRQRIGVKANIEMLFLVHELYKQINAKFTVTVGDTIPYTMFDKTKKQESWAGYVRERVYSLAK